MTKPFSQLLSEAKERRNERIHQQNMYPNLMRDADAALLPRDIIVLPCDVSDCDVLKDSVCDYIVGKIDRNPLEE